MSRATDPELVKKTVSLPPASSSKKKKRGLSRLLASRGRKKNRPDPELGQCKLGGSLERVSLDSRSSGNLARFSNRTFIGYQVAALKLDKHGDPIPRPPIMNHSVELGEPSPRFLKNCSASREKKTAPSNVSSLFKRNRSYVNHPRSLRNLQPPPAKRRKRNKKSRVLQFFCCRGPSWTELGDSDDEYFQEESDKGSEHLRFSFADALKDDEELIAQAQASHGGIDPAVSLQVIESTRISNDDDFKRDSRASPDYDDSTTTTTGGRGISVDGYFDLNLRDDVGPEPDPKVVQNTRSGAGQIKTGYFF